MISTTVRRAALFAILAAMPLSAQRSYKPAVGSLTPYAGYINFGDYASGPIGTRISNQSAAVYGAELGIDVSPNIALVGNIGYSSSDLQVGLPIIGGLSIADTKVLLYDGAIRAKFPLTSGYGAGIVPFVQGGVGQIRYQVKAAGMEAKTDNLAINGAVGADLMLSRGLGIRAMAKDYIGKFDFGGNTRFDLKGKQANNIAYSIGLNLAF